MRKISEGLAEGTARPYITIKISTYKMSKVSITLDSKNSLHFIDFFILVPLLLRYTVCPRSSDLFYIVTYYIKLVTTSWTDDINHVY